MEKGWGLTCDLCESPCSIDFGCGRGKIRVRYRDTSQDVGKSSSNWNSYSFLYLPLFWISWSWVPVSMILPFSMTTIRSARRMVERRWAMTIEVLFWVRLARKESGSFLLYCFSVNVSGAGSANRKIPHSISFVVYNWFN